MSTTLSRFEHDYGGADTPFSGSKSSHFHASRKTGHTSRVEDLGTCNVLSLMHKSDGNVAWNSQPHRPVTIEEIEGVFFKLTKTFRFQKDNCRNMLDFYLKLLDSRASRMDCDKALRTLHADYIGGPKANFRKWYFATEMYNDPESATGRKISQKAALTSWSSTMATLPAIDCVIQVALYLLCWGEANIVRLMPECLCFIFKCCNDFYYSLELETAIIEEDFLVHVITPIYEIYFDQSVVRKGTIIYNSDRDHKDKIGYDDMNQLFWYRSGLDRITIPKKTKLMKLTPQERYLRFNEIIWKKAVYKIFLERRSWGHAWANFTRIWIIHLTVFWYYTTFNSPTLYVHNYQQSLDNQPTTQARLAVMSLAGSLAPLICLTASAIELQMVSWKWPGTYKILIRMIMLVVMLCCNLFPTLFVLYYYPLNIQTTKGLAISIAQFLVSVFTSLYLSFVPSSKLFWLSNNQSRETITGNYHNLEGNNQLASYGIWIAIFGSKFIESYFYIALTTKDPVRVLSTMAPTICAGDSILGTVLCQHHSKLLLAIVYSVDLVLFFIDTYLWYIIWNCVFSICRSFQVGVSIWTPWKNIFSRLPRRIQSNILSTSNLGKDLNKHAVSQIWNSIIIAMYREHLISIEQVRALIYKSYPDAPNEMRTPQFFDSQEDGSSQAFMFDGHSEAERRITFFAPC